MIPGFGVVVLAGREEMIERVRKALGRQSPREHAPRSSLPEAGKPLPPIPPEQLLSHFESELRAVAGIPHRADSPAALLEILRKILPAPGKDPIVLSRNPLLARLDVAARLESINYPVACWPTATPVSADARNEFRKRCFAAPAGITGVDFALVESGTLVLSSASEGSQLASLAPPIHIALYTQSQVLESLEEVLAQLPPGGGQGPAERSVVLITGASRTADIEQITILGVHGPLQLHAILVDS